MIRVGVTGGIGSGKSTVCRLFGCLGVPVYEADSRAKWLTEHHPGIRKEVTALLGKEAYTDDGRYDAVYVASKVFAEKGLLDSLNAIIHPRVKEDTRLWVEKNKDRPYVIKEAAIMGRAGQASGLDFVIAVISPDALRIKRVLARDRHRTREQVEAIIASQASEAYLREIADFIVSNSEEEPLIPQVIRIHEALIAHSASAGG